MNWCAKHTDSFGRIMPGGSDFGVTGRGRCYEVEDHLIVELYHQRNETAIKETDVKYGAFCRQIAFNLLRQYEDAEECVNDTYHAAWNLMPPEFPQSLRAFLGRITRNISISRYRANRAKKRYAGMELLLSELDDCIPSAEGVEQKMERRTLAEAISNWLESLTGDDCTLFVRRYWAGVALKDLARECGCTPNQMAQRMLKLRKELKIALEKEGIAL